MPARDDELGLARARAGGEAREAARPRSGRRPCRAGPAPRSSRRGRNARCIAAASRRPRTRAPASASRSAASSRRPGGGEPRDLSLGDRDLHAGDAARLARAVDAGHARLLPLVHGDRAGARRAAEQARELRVRHEAVADRREVAGDLEARGAVGQDHALEPAAAARLRHPDARAVGRVEEGRRDTAPPREACRESRRAPRVNRASDAIPACSATSATSTPFFASVAATGSSSGARSGDDGRAPGELRAGLRHRLRAARAHDARQRPARKRKEELARAGRENEAPRADDAEPRRRLGRELPAAVLARPRRRPPRRSARPRPSARAARARDARRRERPRPRGAGRSVRPATGASSSTTVRAPLSAARHAAATPAGPAPTTATSHASASVPPAGSGTGNAGLPLRLDAHAVAHDLHAGAPVRHAVDRDAALEADAHRAEDAARLARDGRPAGARAGVLERGGHRDPRGRRRRAAVDRQRDGLRHAPPPGTRGSAGRASDRSALARPRIASAIRRAVPSDVVMPRPSCPAATKSPGAPSTGPISGRLSGVDGPKARPRPDRAQPRERRHELQRAADHAVADPPVDAGLEADELARGAEQHLARRARLEVEGDRLGRGRVRALEVPELDELVAAEAGMAVRDDEVALARLRSEGPASAAARRRRPRSRPPRRRSGPARVSTPPRSDADRLDARPQHGAARHAPGRAATARR